MTVEATGFEAARRAAGEALAAGDASAAFGHLRPALSYPARPSPEQLTAGLALLAEVATALGHQELAGDARRAADDVHDPDALYELGYALVEAGLPAIAAVVLTRCLEVVPGSEQVLTELVSALERSLAYRDAQRLLEAHPHLVDTSFLCRYLVAYNAAMAGDLVTTRRHAELLAPADEGETFLASRITGLLDRADRITGLCRLDDGDLRGWHYVLTGGLLTHLSPYGFDEPMRGRYAWLQDSPGRVRTGLGRLASILAAWGERPDCIYAPPGRDHEVLAHAASLVLDLPVMPWPAVGVPAPGLVVLYDLGTVDGRDLERLVQRRPGQILYAHASPWTEDGPVAPDVTTLLHQSLTAPWGERLVVDAEQGTTGRAAADERPAEEVGAEIAASDGLGADEIAVDAEETLAALAERVGPPPQGRRERLWAGSPVQSNRFE